MCLEINDKDFHTLNEFDNFFEFTYPLFIRTPEIACPELAKICKNLKTDLLSNGKSTNIDNTTLLYRARKVYDKDLSYEKDNNEELSFWKGYLDCYFACSNCKILQEDFIQKQASRGNIINNEIGKALSAGYLGYNKDKSGDT